jgi:hypothetical protein
VEFLPSPSAAVEKIKTALCTQEALSWDKQCIFNLSELLVENDFGGRQFAMSILNSPALKVGAGRNGFEDVHVCFPR